MRSCSPEYFSRQRRDGPLSSHAASDDTPTAAMAAELGPPTRRLKLLPNGRLQGVIGARRSSSAASKSRATSSRLVYIKYVRPSGAWWGRHVCPLSHPPSLPSPSLLSLRCLWSWHSAPRPATTCPPFGPSHALVVALLRCRVLSADPTFLFPSRASLPSLFSLPFVCVLSSGG